MKKLTKSIATLLAVLAFFAVGFAAGCGDTETEYTFQIAVQYADGTGAANVNVAICAGESFDEGGKCTFVPTDSDGKIEYTTEAGTYNIHILRCPEGYSNDEEIILNGSKKSHTFVLTAVAEN